MPARTSSTAQQYAVADRLDDRWSEFVDCAKRRSTMAPFISAYLPSDGHCSVLDAAMGIGCEVEYLLDHCDHVVGNEINKSLLRSALQRFEAHSRLPEITHVLWQELDSHFAASEFDIALMLGNSLCLVEGEEARQKIARAFWKVLRPGGMLIIDERNFEYLLDERVHILRDGFRYRSHVVYCGTEVEGYPISIEDDEIIFQFRTAKGGEVLGHRTMFPLAPGEIRRLFVSNGFTEVSKFSDLELRDDSEADFYTYVFRRNR